jgi:hypothetical protein
VTVATEPEPLADRIAAAMAGHTANISNGDGTVICNCGTTVGANPAAWREHRAATVLAVVQPELDQRDAEIRRLRQHVEELQSKAMSCGNGQCCCSFDGPGDVCMVHSPTVDQLQSELRVSNELLTEVTAACSATEREAATLRAELADTDSRREARERRVINRSAPGSAGERIENIAFDLATASRIVPPDEVQAAIAALRAEAFTEAAAIARQTTVPAESGRNWHWFQFACNRVADRLLAAVPAAAPTR